MPVAKVVLNASPLILLCNSELDFILPQLFTEIVIPHAVWQEIMAGPPLDRAAKQLPELDWLQKVQVDPIPDIVRWDLGMGETEVLSLVMRHNENTAVLDDMLAKKCARSLDLKQSRYLNRCGMSLSQAKPGFDKLSPQLAV